ncbi:MAG TPA: hypothetical protein VEK79_07195 [Thermoanaerobaculia bacterium]|nr:hypothetical protein [Thermoanaerobaculia bacterium]
MFRTHHRSTRLIATVAAILAIALELLLVRVSGDGASNAFVFRVVLAAIAIVLIWSRVAMLAALCALVMFFPSGLYVLGAENHFRLLGVMHLVIFVAAIMLGFRTNSRPSARGTP